MNLYYSWEYYQGRKFKTKTNKVNFCCDEMKLAFDDKFIGFGEYDTSLNTDTDINIYKCSPYPEGAVWDSMKIYKCLFCGEDIEIIEMQAYNAAAVKLLPRTRMQQDHKSQ